MKLIVNGQEFKPQDNKINKDDIIVDVSYDRKQKLYAICLRDKNTRYVLSDYEYARDKKEAQFVKAMMQDDLRNYLDRDYELIEALQQDEKVKDKNGRDFNIWTESTGDYEGNYMKIAYVGDNWIDDNDKIIRDNILGYLEYSVLDDNENKAYVQMIEVKKSEQRKGVATALINSLQKDYKEIDYGYTTEDGTQLLHNLGIRESVDSELTFKFPNLQKAIDYYWSDRDVKVERVPIEQLVKDNNLLNDCDLESYHKALWGNKPASEFSIDTNKVNSMRTTEVPYVVRKKDGKLELGDGRHRTRALYNDGYKYVELPVINETLNSPNTELPKNDFSKEDDKLIDLHKINENTANIPTKTGKAYKVFRVKNGKLYPPMVANKDNKDTPIGVWLDAEEGEFAGLSKTGRPQVKRANKSGVLAYRPGWHLGDIPRAKQFDRLNKETGEYEFPKDFVWAECDYAMDIDYQSEADEQGYMRTKVDDKGNVITTKSDKYQHSLAGLKKLPANGYYRYRTNPDPDTVPWVITGKMKVDKLLDDFEVNEILKQNGIEPIHRQGGDKTLKELGLNESLNEEVFRDGRNKKVTITPNPNEVANIIRNNETGLRILYDDNIKQYMVCNVNDFIHMDMMSVAIENYFYPPRLDVNEYNKWSYKDEAEYEDKLFFLIYIPLGMEDDIWGYKVEDSQDDYDTRYNYDFGYIVSRGCDFTQCDLYYAFDKPNSITELNGMNEPVTRVVEDLTTQEQKQLKEIDDLINDLYKLRQESIQQFGEFGVGNLVFKEMRNLGYLDNLKTLKRKLQSKEMSLGEGLLLEKGTDYRKQAIKIIVDSGLFNEETATKIIDGLFKQDIHAFNHAPAWLEKYLKGIARMMVEYCDGNPSKAKQFLLDNVDVIDYYLTWVKANREKEGNQLDDEFVNKLTIEELNTRVNKMQDAQDKKSQDELSQMEFENSNYTLVPIDSYEQLHKLYGGNKTGDGTDTDGHYAGNKGTSWCHTNSEGTYDDWVNDGKNKFFVLQRNDWQDIKFDSDTNFEQDGKDEYGTSLIAILVSNTGKLKNATLRGNHLGISGSADHQYETYAELSKIAGFNVQEEVAKHIKTMNPMELFGNEVKVDFGALNYDNATTNPKYIIDCYNDGYSNDFTPNYEFSDIKDILDIYDISNSVKSRLHNLYIDDVDTYNDLIKLIETNQDEELAEILSEIKNKLVFAVEDGVAQGTLNQTHKNLMEYIDQILFAKNIIRDDRGYYTVTYDEDGLNRLIDYIEENADLDDYGTEITDYDLYDLVEWVIDNDRFDREYEYSEFDFDSFEDYFENDLIDLDYELEKKKQDYLDKTYGGKNIFDYNDNK